MKYQSHNQIFWSKAKNAPKVLILFPIKKCFTILISFFTLCPKLRNWWLYPLSVFGFLKKDKEYEFNYKNGLKVKFRGGSYDAYIHADIMGNEEYKNWIKTDISKINSAVDIGAQTGVFSLYILSCNPNIKITCVEAVKSNFDILSNNLSINNFSNQTTLLNKAAWRESGSSIDINLNESNTGGHSIFISNSKSYKGSEKLSTVSLEDIIGGGYCDLLKVDIEGAEYDLFQGADDSVFNKIKNIVMEVHGESSQVQQLVDLLDDKGYEIHLRYPHLWASKVAK